MGRDGAHDLAPPRIELAPPRIELGTFSPVWSVRRTVEPAGAPCVVHLVIFGSSNLVAVMSVLQASRDDPA